MKKLLLLLIILPLVILTKASNEHLIKSKIDRVTVYLSGAQVFRKAKFTVEPGIHEIILDSVSPYLQAQSLQASGTDAFTILDVRHSLRYIQPPAQKPIVVPQEIHDEIEDKTEELTLISFKIGQIDARITNLTAEKNMITQNKLMKGGGQSDSLAGLIDVVEFYRRQLEDIEDHLYEARLKQHYLKTEQTEIQARLGVLRSYNQRVGQPVIPTTTVHQVVVSIYTKTRVSASVEVNYIVNVAGWHPAYDLRATDTDKPMKITYKANVYQTSGFDWDNVKLTLSTNNPRTQTMKPTLPVWLVDYYRNPQISASQYANSNFAMKKDAYKEQVAGRPAVREEEQNLGYAQFDDNNDPGLAMKLTEVHRAISHLEFKVQYKYSVNTDGKQVLMLIQEKEVPAEFFHYVVPKINKDVFVLAQISDWESLDLLPAQANIYFDNSYIGQTTIDPVSMEDTMEVALGIDRSIIVTRKKIEDDVQCSKLTKRATRTVEIAIDIKSSKNSSITLEVQDQVPVTKNEEIEITMLKDGKGDLEEATGTLSWKIELGAAEKKSLKFSYKVEYDKHEKVM